MVQFNSRLFSIIVHPTVPRIDADPTPEFNTRSHTQKGKGAGKNGLYVQRSAVFYVITVSHSVPISACNLRLSSGRKTCNVPNLAGWAWPMNSAFSEC